MIEDCRYVEGDAKSRWFLLPGVYARGRNRSHTGKRKHSVLGYRAGDLNSLKLPFA